MTSTDKLIREPISFPFRRVSIRRRQLSDGKYEENWLDITEFIKRYGGMKISVDDLKLNKFTNSGLTLKVRNDTGAFRREDNANSLWNGYLTRYGTKVKLEAGYLDTNGSGFTEFPTDSSVGIFIMSDEIPISGVSNDAVIKCRSLISVFNDVRAVDVPGLGTTQTASELMTTIRDHTDGSGNAVFQEYISSGAWAIQTTTNYYNFATSTSLQGLTVWGLMQKVAESEGFIVKVNRFGGFEFQDREPNTTSVSYSFYGQGFPRQNVIKLVNLTEALNKHFNFFRMKYLEADTTTSYVTAGTVTAIDPSNTSWKYGSRVYEIENLFVTNTATAQTIVDDLFTEFKPLKDEITVVSKLAPHLDVSDRTALWYRSYDASQVSLWDQMVWDVDNWDAESGENFDFGGDEFKILSISTDLDKFTTIFKLREV